MGYVKINGVNYYVSNFLYSMSNILHKDSSKVTYTQTLIVSKKFDNFGKRSLRVTETSPSRIYS